MKKTLWYIFSLALILGLLLSVNLAEGLALFENVGIIEGDFSAGIIEGDFSAGIIEGDFSAGIIEGDFSAGIIEGDLATSA